ncbi:MAG TPA: DHA2 family efflux MFS transporter permease subunit [Jatrophihabitans sp.]|nr:DHA2 family efflux MFS transporter permease subunit [Jatrophihabitans sp.]
MNNVYQPASVEAGNRPALLLVVACGAQLLVVLDALIVNVALPQMRAGLDMSAAAQQWIVDGYLITFGGLLLLAARAADLLGHRQVFLAGTAVFTLASLAGGLAQNTAMLLAARLAQGIGAAALAPSSLSLLTTTHTGTQRARALSIWSATSGSAGALGLVLGGLITSALGWRWVLLVNVPVGVLLCVVAAATLVPGQARDRRPLNVLGAVTVTLGVATLTYGISQTGEYGWAAPRVVAAMLATVALLGLFACAEQRSPGPLLPPTILRRRNVLVANAIVAGLGAIMTGTLYFLSLYQQRILGDSPLRTGLTLVPMSAVLTLGAIAAKSLLPRFGARRLITIGGVVMAAGLGWLATLSVHGDYALHILGPTLVWAAGAGIVTMPCVALATTGIEAEHAGLASGLVNTARQAGGAIGLAVLAAVAGTATAHSGAAGVRERIAHGYGVAMIVAAVLAVLVALTARSAQIDERA